MLTATRATGIARFAAFGTVWATIVLFPPEVCAQASIAGTVKDTSGAVLPGVTVEASSPALIEKVRSEVTNDAGEYRIVDLRPGVYTVTFTLPGFSVLRREGIELAGSFTATVNIELKVGGLAETVTVTSASPIVDIQTARQQQVLNRAAIDALPTARTPLSLSVLVPGVTGSVQDVGGTNSIGLFTATIHGGQAIDYRQLIDGFGTGNSYDYFSALSANMASTQEMVLDVAAASAEQGPGGVIVNAIPKDGGNTFSGSFFITGANSGTQGDNFTQRVKDRGLTTRSSVKNIYDINPAGGGPVFKDKLWFYVGARSVGYENYTGGIFFNANAGNPNAWTYVPDLGRRGYNLTWQRGGNGRATWQVNQKNKLSFYYDRQARCQCAQVSALVSPEAASEFLYTPSELGTVTWSSPVTNRVLIQAGSAFRRREDYQFYERASRVPGLLNLIPVTDLFNGLSYHGPAVGATPAEFTTASQSIPQVRAAISYISGAHEMKVGLTDQHMSYDDVRTDNNSSVSYNFFNGVPVSIVERAAPFDTHQRSPLNLALFAQDKYTVHRLTVMGGVRFEWYRTSYPAEYFGPGPLVPTRSFTIPGADYWNVKDVVPRFGAVYDLFGNGRTALKGSANKYLTTLSGTSFFAGNPFNTLATTATRAWTPTGAPATNPNYFVPNCILANPAANGDCGAISNALFGLPVPATKIDPTTYTGWGHRAYNWEFSAAVQQQVAPRVSAEIGYFRRIYGNFLATENRALAPSDFDQFSITTPADPRLPNGGGTAVAGFHDLNPTKYQLAGVPTNNYQTFASQLGNEYQHWNGVDVNLNARLPHEVLIRGGFSTGRTVADTCAIASAHPEVISTMALDNTTFNTGLAPAGTPQVPASFCHIEQNFLTQVKVVGSYLVPRAGVQLAATFQSLPGPLILANYVASTTQVAASLGRPLSGGASSVVVSIVPPGTLYGERLNQLDLRFGKALKLARTRTQVNLDLYNALNADTILTQSNAYGIWQRAQSIIQARFLKLSLQFEF